MPQKNRSPGHKGDKRALSGATRSPKAGACAFSSPTTMASMRQASGSWTKSHVKSPASTARSGPWRLHSSSRAWDIASATPIPRCCPNSGRNVSRRKDHRADCVLAGLHQVMKDAPPDLVLSGVNRGNNAAENVLYSGTVGAAIEAALQGIPAIALSQFFGPESANLETPFEAALGHGAETVRKLLKGGIWEDESYRVFYNVNFPPNSAAAVRGVRVTTQGWRDGEPDSESSRTARRRVACSYGSRVVRSTRRRSLARMWPRTLTASFP